MPRIPDQPGALVAPRDLRTPATAALAAAAVAVGVGAWEHARLYHDGYSSIAWIGPLFLVNAVASLVVLLLLIARRPLPFAAGSLLISVGSIVALVLTRTTGLFGFEESGYDGAAVVTLVSEVLAVALTVLGVLLARDELRAPPGTRTADDPATEVLA